MNFAEKRIYLIKRLLDEDDRFFDLPIPGDEARQRELLRSLMNVRMPAPIDAEFLAVQDEYLKEAILQKGVTKLSDLTPLAPHLYLWQGDITTLSCDAIVNAANSGMTGCYQPCHSCIDNCIHTYAGIELRLECDALMRAQKHPEPTGSAKVTKAYNLPCRYVIHTVGPIVDRRLTAEKEQQLASCYRACLFAARDADCRSIAFCCISTGVFGFPQGRAAEIAVQTVREEKPNDMDVIFNVFRDDDYAIYKKLLG